MKKLYPSIVIALLSITTFAQDAEKMRKHLKVTYSDKYDKTATISFDHKNPNKHGFDEISAAFRNAFVSHHFTVKDNPQYILSMDYGYLYSIPRYRMQYSNLTAEIIDLNNNRTVIATIVYNGKFELDAISDAVAVELNKAITPKVAGTPSVEKQNTPTIKSKEDKLAELKNLLEKNLISKEEYDRARKKIIEE